ncbi:DUF3500 domain-containing protein [Chitinophaga sp. RCC_12]|uniref:DUF3500 domain-containing protein n=1 Tax=Chitinophaga sp. RCC_12 TaxID=3239226 RepID=UPI003525AD92
MHRLVLLFIIGCCVCTGPLQAQEMSEKANRFIRLLSKAQQAQTLFPFDTGERYHFAYVPRDDRKGISVNELNPAQRKALMDLLNTALSETTVKKVNDIMQLDQVLKQLEHREENDHYRDPGKYFVTIFGVPAANTIWGWRFEGHHVAFNFSADKKELVAGTPAFLGANPAIVLDGPQKDKEVLKEETTLAFDLVHALSPPELQQALVTTKAPAEIITGNSRNAMIAHPEGIRFKELSPAHQQLLLQLINVYVHRFTKLFADKMLKDIQQDGLDNLWFTWAGSTVHALGNPCYYRIQGPGLIIEYDNTQNNANHIHTIVRDLKNDFGGDLLLEHYRAAHAR